MNRRWILRIEPGAPAKPAPGAPCNGCGVCCLGEPCPLGMLLSRRRRGACAMLRWRPQEGRYRCGALGRLSWLDGLLRRWIAAGSGCDCDWQVESLEAAPAKAGQAAAPADPKI